MKIDRRFVEITTVLQGVHGLDEARQKNPESYAEAISKSQDQVYVCNYRLVDAFQYILLVFLDLDKANF